MNGIEFITPGDIKGRYQISYTTLRRWEKEGKVRTRKTPGGNRRYCSEDIRKAFGEEDTVLTCRANYIYARVSSDQQKPDLERQITDLKRNCHDPNAIIIKDVGSGINWNRPGFKRLLELVDERKVATLTIAHRDRLCRFAYELVEWIFEKAGVKIMVLSQGENHNPDPQKELKRVVRRSPRHYQPLCLQKQWTPICKK